MSARLKYTLIWWFVLFVIFAWLYVLFSVLWEDDSWNWMKWDISSINNHQNKSIYNSENEILIGTDEKNTDENQKWDNQDKEELTILMLDYMVNNWIKDIIKETEEEWYKVTSMQVSNIDKLKQIYDLNNKSGTNIFDVALIPTDRLDDGTENISKIWFSKWFDKDFHYLFNDYINNENYTMIPYWIDPYVVFSLRWSYNRAKFNLDWLLRELTVSTNNGNINIISWLEFLFWISEDDISLLSKWEQPYSDYFMILYNIIFQSYMVQDEKYIEKFIDFWNKKKDNYRSNSKFNNLVSFISKKQPECAKYPNICLFSKWYSEFLPWFLSYMDIYEKNFLWSEVKLSDIEIYNFFDISNSYPVRWWWFVVNKNNNINSSWKFINKYLELARKDNWLKLWSNMYTALNKHSNKQIFMKSNDWSNIKWYYYKFIFFEWKKELMKDFIKETKILEVLKWEYSNMYFLKNLDWVF